MSPHHKLSPVVPGTSMTEYFGGQTDVVLSCHTVFLKCASLFLQEKGLRENLYT